MSFLFGGEKQPRVNNIRVTESSQGRCVLAAMGQTRVHQSLLWSDGLLEWKIQQGKGLGGKGQGYYYAADVIASIGNGEVTSIANVWYGQSWLSTNFSKEFTGVGSNGSPGTPNYIYGTENSAVFAADSGVATTNSYGGTYNDYGAPSPTVLSGTDYTPLIKIPYDPVTPVPTGKYSVNPNSIGTFVVTSVETTNGVTSVYHGTFTGGASPWPTGASNCYVGFVFTVAGFTHPANNGTFVCKASTASTLTLANTIGIAETKAATAMEVGNSYHFSASDYAMPIMVNYQYSIQNLQKEELGYVDSAGKITIGGTYSPTYDVGVWYYDTNSGTTSPETMMRFTKVNGTPTAAGQYKFHTPGDGSTGGATYTFYVGAGGDLYKQVLIRWQYQNLSAASGNAASQLNYELFGGTLKQGIWPFILSGGSKDLGNVTVTEAAFPDAALGYNRTAYLAYGPMALGAAAEIQDITVEVTTPYSYGGYYSTGVDEGQAIVDCNPLTCIYEVLTNNVWGLGTGTPPFPVSCIDNGIGGTWGNKPSITNVLSTPIKAPANAYNEGNWCRVQYLAGNSGNTNDGKQAGAAAANGLAYVNGFGFNVPSNATIQGVQVTFQAGTESSSGGGTIQMYLCNSTGAVPTDLGNTEQATVNYHYHQYQLGANDDLWGATLTPAIVNSSLFGVVVTSPGTWVWIYNVTVRIFYTLASTAHAETSTAWSWFVSNSYFISPTLDSQNSASGHIGEWLEAGMCAAFMSEGLLKLVPYGTQTTAGNGCTWVAPSQVVVALDDTCFLKKEGEDPVKIERSAWQDACNEVQIKWNNRAFQYSDELTQDFDQASINRYGLRLEEAKSYNFICQLSAAQFAANMRLKRMVNIRNTYTFNVPYIYSYIEPGDLVEITTSSSWAADENNANLGIVTLPVRVLKVVDNPGEEGLEITAEDSLFHVGLPTLYNKGLAAGVPRINKYLQPGDTEVVLLEATSRMTGFKGNEIWIGALGNTSNWGGCNILVSQDGSKYQQIGTITTPARIGVLVTELPSGSDPDTANTLEVELADNSQTLDAGTTADADAGNTLCFVDGEIIAYSTCSVTGINIYTMGATPSPYAAGYLRRGLMNSTISSHAIGGYFVRLDQAIFKYTYDPQWAGETVYFKFQSFNTFENCPQDLSTVAAIAFTIPGKNPGSIDAASGLPILHGPHVPLRPPIAKPVVWNNVGAGTLAWAPVSTD